MKKWYWEKLDPCKKQKVRESYRYLAPVETRPENLAYSLDRDAPKPPVSRLHPEFVAAVRRRDPACARAARASPRQCQLNGQQRPTVRIRCCNS
jgi:hypothetical protein